MGDNNSSTRGAKSPFNSADWPSHGLINSSHVTDLTMVYKPGSLLTPWPWVLGSILLSVLLGSISVWTSWKKKRRSDPRRQYLYNQSNVSEKQKVRQDRALASLAALGVVASTVRAIAALVISVRVSITDTGSFGAPSALLILMASLHISITNLSLAPAFSYLVQLGFLLAWIAAIINFSGGAASTFYSNAVVVGGRCAFPYHDCIQEVSDNGMFPPTDYGCPSGSPALQGSNLPNNTIRITEICWGGVSCLYGGIVFLYHPTILRILILPIELGKLLKAHGMAAFSRWTWGPWFHVPEDADLDAVARKSWMGRVYKSSPRRNILIAQGIALAIVFVVCCVAIPLHIITEVHPKSSGTYIDGSPISAGLGADVGAWTDCFDLRPPSDRLGFWRLWWNGKTAWVVHAVGVI